MDGVSENPGRHEATCHELYKQRLRYPGIGLQHDLQKSGPGHPTGHYSQLQCFSYVIGPPFLQNGKKVLQKSPGEEKWPGKGMNIF